MFYDEEQLRLFYGEAPSDIALDDIDLKRLPSHISMIMDGNGRWATSRGLDRSRGHVAGIEALRDAITAGVRLGIDVLSAYAFSTENWSRPKVEVDLLMKLFAKTLVAELPLFYQENVRLEILGNLDILPKKTRETFEYGISETAGHTGMVLALAVNYGSRSEIARAAKLIAEDVSAGRLTPDEVDEAQIASRLYSHGLPDPDLLIRTSGELRLSNFLLWQVAYSEIFISDVLWPDFDRWELLRAIRSYQARNRRFGGVSK